MTDFASLLVADRGQRPGRSTSSTRRASPPGPRRGRPRTARSSTRIASTARSRRFVAPAARRRFRGRGRRQGMHSALSPWCLASSPRSLPEGPTSWLMASPAWPRSAGCSPSTVSTSTAPKPDEPERGPRVLVTGEAARIEATVRLAEATAPRPRPGQHARRRSRPGRDRGGGTRRSRSARARTSASLRATELAARLSADRRGRRRCDRPSARRA